MERENPKLARIKDLITKGVPYYDPVNVENVWAVDLRGRHFSGIQDPRKTDLTVKLKSVMISVITEGRKEVDENDMRLFNELLDQGAEVPMGS